MTALEAERIFGVSSSSLRHKWGWIVALGIFVLVGGFIALTDELAATVVSVLATGLAMMATGVMEIITGVQIRPWSRALFWTLVGVAMVIGGALIFRDPLLAAAGLTMALGVCLVVSGVFRTVLAFQLRDSALWLMVALSGVLSVIVGALILGQWPASSLYVIGLLLGVNMIFAGASWLGLGLTLRPSSSA
jgi:uncharacterized membrane protein HdeD (DUF308 family)